MSSGTYRIFIVANLLLVLIVNFLFAGTTGKIAGRVTDKENSEPLIGTNVIVRGTSLGAATDIDGYYTILNIPPGVHTITVSMVGYAPMTINEVRVLIDQTATVNIEMTSQAIETGVIEVIAERHVVKKDVSSSVSAIPTEEIKSLPISSVNEMMNSQAGVEDGFIIRGGDADQLLLQVDGATQRDPRNNKPISNIALSSIEEISIEKGGFTAEYGQVRSGIINIVQKEADVAHYSGSINVKYSPPQQKYFGISVYDPNSMWLRPYLDPAVCWTGTGNGNWNQYMRNQYPSFEGGWNAVSQSLLSDSDPTNDLSPAGCKRLFEYQHRRKPDTKSPDYNIDGSFGGPVPIIGVKLGDLRFFTSFIMNREMLLIPLSRPDYQDYNWSIKLSSDIDKKSKLMISASTGKSYNVAINRNDAGSFNQVYNTGGATFWNPTDYMRTPDQIAQISYDPSGTRSSRFFVDGWYNPAVVSDFIMGAKFTSILNSSTFYEVSVQNVHRNYLTGPIAARDTNKNYEIVPGYWVDEGPFGFSSDLSASGIGDPTLFFGGWGGTVYDTSKLNTFTLKGDLTSQVNKEHLMKAGIEFSYYNLDLNYSYINPYKDMNEVKQQWNPYQLSAYVQDKIEAYGFIANLGLRVDISNPNTDWVKTENPFDAYFSNAYSDTIEYVKTSVKPDVSVSPRLGISHPITESSKLYFNYGHFKQMPAYEEIFRIGRGSDSKMQNYGDPNLVQARTISYELGFDQSLSDIYLIQIAAFYNDISNQQSYTFYTSDKKAVAYYAANNNSYSDIRGVELTLRKNSGDWVRGFINYTYQVTKAGLFGQVTSAYSANEQKEEDTKRVLPLYAIERQRGVPQPRANASIILITPKDFGPMVAGFKPLADWTLNLLGTWKAGQWLTYNPQNAGNILNNVQVTDYYNINLRLNKTFTFKTFAVTLFMETRNLLNTKLLSGESFYNTDDYLNYMYSLHLPTSPAYNNKNIPGDDRVGDYRTVPYQPVLLSGNVDGMPVGSIDPIAIYYSAAGQYAGKYMIYVNGGWSEVDHNRMQKILDDKAYIDMPNNSSFDFLNPRQFYYGINLSFNL